MKSTYEILQHPENKNWENKNWYIVISHMEGKITVIDEIVAGPFDTKELALDEWKKFFKQIGRA